MCNTKLHNLNSTLNLWRFPLEYGVIAFAMYYFTYDPWIGKLLYLEDFFVMQDYRGEVVDSDTVDDSEKFLVNLLP